MKKLSAYEWGIKHGSCQEALVERRKFSSQAEWWKNCQRMDWLIWQLKHLPMELYFEQLQKAIDVIVERAVRNCALPCSETREWAEKWLSEEDRSEDAAIEAARKAETAWAAGLWEAWRAKAAARAAMWAAGTTTWTVARAGEWAAAAAGTAAEIEELALQADDIHRFIPEWPGGDE